MQTPYLGPIIHSQFIILFHEMSDSGIALLSQILVKGITSFEVPDVFVLAEL